MNLWQSLMAAGAMAVLPVVAAQGATPKAYPLWNSQESVSDYATRAGIPDPEITLDLGDKLTVKLTLIPAGTFQMGSANSTGDERFPETPQHEITLTKPFYMGVTEITQPQYQALMAANPSSFKTLYQIRGGVPFREPGAADQTWNPARYAPLPVNDVLWDEATEFCSRLAQKTGRKVRLPTEAEWEYAYRAGTKTTFYWGENDKYADWPPEPPRIRSKDKVREDNPATDYAWYADNCGERLVHPVGQLKPNAWGLYDMGGNVPEWCRDWYEFDRNYYENTEPTDPPGPATGQAHVVRGGSGSSPISDCQAARRRCAPPKDRGNRGGMSVGHGFRVVVPLE